MNGLVQNVALIGDTASGKTSFISILRWMGEPNNGSPFQNLGADGNSKKYLDGLFSCINQGLVPPGTEHETELKFSEKYTPHAGAISSTFNFNLRDYKGGDLKSLDKDSPLFQSWASSDVLLVMLDVAKVREGGGELRSNLKCLWDVLGREEMNPGSKRVAVVFTQADKLNFSRVDHSSEKAMVFLEDNLPGFGKILDTAGFREWRCFLLASLGLEPKAEDGGIKKLEIENGEPVLNTFGYEELFDWLVVVKRKQWLMWFVGKSKPYVFTVVAVLLVFVAVVSFGLYRAFRAAKIVNDPTATVVQKAAATGEMKVEDRVQCVEDRIDRFKRTLDEHAGNQSAIEEIVKRENEFWENAVMSEEQRKRVNGIILDCKEALENRLVDTICSEVERGEDDSALNHIGEYERNRFITKMREEDVSKSRKTIRQRLLAVQRAKIANCVIGGTGDVEQMKQKLSMIREFRGYESEEQSREAARAVNDMQKLVEKQTFAISRIYVGTLKSNRKLFTMVASGVGWGTQLKDAQEEGHAMAWCSSHKDGIEVEWDDGELGKVEVPWKLGDAVRVEVYRQAYKRAKIIAALDIGFGDWLGLLQLLSGKTQMNICNSYDNFEGLPWVKIESRDFPDPEESLRLIKRYVLPGTYWQGEE